MMTTTMTMMMMMMIQVCCLSLQGTLKMEVARSSEMLVSCHITVLHHNPQDHDLKHILLYNSLSFLKIP
jgi:hypothetical protein